MLAVCISDTHLRHNISIPDGDILIHSGDATISGDYSEIRQFADWFRGQPYKYKIFVAGNHDWLFQRDPRLARKLLGKEIIYLQDSSIEIEDIKFYGSPWQPTFCGWAFNLDRKEIVEKWNLIPSDIDFLITHGPPYGILDTAHKYGEYLGCKDLIQRVQIVKPKWHQFGHIHGGAGMLKRGGTQFINASICDEAYKPTNLPVIIDLHD